MIYCSGGGGGADSAKDGIRTSHFAGLGGTGAGDGGGSFPGVETAIPQGGNASGYGCGGGGGTCIPNTATDPAIPYPGGKGFQGVVIIRYRMTLVEPPVIGGEGGAAVEVTADGFKVRISNYNPSGSYGYQESDSLQVDWSELEVHPLPAPVDGVFTIPWGESRKPADFYRIVVE